MTLCRRLSVAGLVAAGTPGPTDNSNRVGDAFHVTADSSWHIAWDWLSKLFFAFGGVQLTIFNIIHIVIILTIAWWVSRFGRRGIERLYAMRPNMNRASAYTLSRLLHCAVMTIGFLIGLSVIGIDLSKFALFASALGVGVGFGLQTLVRVTITWIARMSRSRMR